MLKVLAFGGATQMFVVSGVIEFILSMMHQFWNSVLYKSRSKMCVSSFIGFVLAFSTCAAELVWSVLNT